MKEKYGKIGTIILLAALLLSGCGKAETPAAQPVTEPETQETAAEAAQETEKTSPAAGIDIDDSLRFVLEVDTNAPHDIVRAEEYFLNQAYPQQMAEYFDDFELVESYGYVNGWMLFSGEPKTEISWPYTEQDGKRLYCRSYTLSSQDLVNWSAEKSYPMEPLRELESDRFIGNYQQEDYILYDKVVKDLVSAELYVVQEGKSYTVTDSSTLKELERALSPKAHSNFQGRIINTGFAGGTDDYNPLYLSFADGSRKLVYTARDGADAVRIWSETYAYDMDKSIFELFGVDIPAAGYASDENGNTIAAVKYIECETNPSGQPVEMECTREFIYDVAGNLADCWFYIDYADERHVQHESYRYDEQGCEIWHGYYDVNEKANELFNWTATEYNEKRQIIQETAWYYTDDGAEQISNYHTYTYDELGRLTAEVFHYRDGTENLGSSNFYYYDDQGLRHVYLMDEEGNLYRPGEQNSDTPLRKD